MELLNEYREKARVLIENRIKKLYNIEIKAQIDDAPEGFGDFSYSCFGLAKKLNRNPAEIAKELADITIEFFEYIKSIEGYVNFSIFYPKFTESLLNLIIKEQNNYGTESVKDKVVLEHTSANPTGPLHIGRARNTIIGDTLARILKKYGYDVETQYFVNDVGKQSALLIWGISNFKKEDKNLKKDHELVKYYQMAYEIQNIEKNIEEMLSKYEKGDRELIEFSRKYIDLILEGIQQSVAKLNVKYDRLFYESDLILNGFVAKVAGLLKNYVKEEDGAIYIDMFELGDKEHNKIYLFRKDGTSLYFTRDIAYHIEKSKISKNLINVLGEDHKAHAESVTKVLNKVDPSINIDTVFYSFVSLPEGRMSTRKGTVVYLDDLMDEGIEKAKEEILKRKKMEGKELEDLAFQLGTSAIRYNIVKVQSEKTVVFKWEEALNFEGDAAPFLQYTYARANSILKKVANIGPHNASLLSHPEELKLVKLLTKYPTIIRSVSTDFKPYKLARYGYDLASQFNQFYRDCPVLKADEPLRSTRLKLVECYRIVMKDALETLGLNTPEEI